MVAQAVASLDDGQLEYMLARRLTDTSDNQGPYDNSLSPPSTVTSDNQNLQFKTPKTTNPPAFYYFRLGRGGEGETETLVGGGTTTLPVTWVSGVPAAVRPVSSR